jgi:integrase
MASKSIDDRWFTTDKVTKERVKSSRHGNGKRYRARFRDEDGREPTKSFHRKTDASTWLDEQTASIVRGDYVPPRAGDVKVEAFAGEWLAMQSLRESSSYNYESHLRRHVYPAFGTRSLSSIAPSHVQAWVKGLTVGDPARGQKPLAPSTAGVVHAVLHSVMAAAVLDKRIKANPCDGTKLPKDDAEHQVVPMTTEQMTAVRDGMPLELVAMIVLGAGTGVRQSEALGLTVDRVDFLRRTVRIDRQLVAVPGKPVRLGPLKTKASNRTIPLPKVVVDALAEHLRAYPATEPSNEPFPVADHGVIPGLIFTRQVDGETWTRQRFGHVWRPVAKAAGLPPRTGFHALRHYYASLLIRHGESVKTVQARLGHASAKETLDVYSHLWPDSDDRTREAIDSVMLAPADSVRTERAGVT